MEYLERKLSNAQNTAQKAKEELSQQQLAVKQMSERTRHIKLEEDNMTKVVGTLAREKTMLEAELEVATDELTNCHAEIDQLREQVMWLNYMM